MVARTRTSRKGSNVGLNSNKIPKGDIPATVVFDTPIKVNTQERRSSVMQQDYTPLKLKSPPNKQCSEGTFNQAGIS